MILKNLGWLGIQHQIFKWFKKLFKSSQIENIMVDLQYICSVGDDSWALWWSLSTFLCIWGVYDLIAGCEFTVNPPRFHHKSQESTLTTLWNDHPLGPKSLSSSKFIIKRPNFSTLVPTQPGITYNLKKRKKNHALYLQMHHEFPTNSQQMSL